MATHQRRPQYFRFWRTIRVKFPSTSYLVNITLNGRHVALLTTHDDGFLEFLTAQLEAAGYTAETNATPSNPLRKRT